MEKQSKYLIILLVALVICVAVFWFQFNNNVSTFMILNETEINEDGSFSGLLMDAYSYGVANKTITYQQPDGKVLKTDTDENGEFTITHAQYLPNKDNKYSNFTFDGDGKYLGCTYEGNVSVVAG